MKGFCPSCEQESVLTRIFKTEEVEVKGERIPVDMDYYQCLECGEEFDNPDPAYDPLAAAYREYRRRRGMVQPEEIRAFRETYGLSQRELAGLVGFGGATLSRYENGSLQDETHDTILRLIMLPANLLKVVTEDTSALSAEKRQEIIARLGERIDRDELIRLINRKGKYGSPNIFNGEKDIDLRRLANTVNILCYCKNIYKTRLNKLLFYADFKHYKEHGQGITGLCYAHLPYGPVPEQYEIILQRLTELDESIKVEDDPTLETEGVYYRCDAEPARSQFSFAELQTLIQVDAFFDSFTSSRIKYFSREEEGCRRTQNGELISYEYAARLRI